MAARASGTPTTTGVQHRNEVRLVGRLGASPEQRTLPSGDEIVTFRLVVDRLPRRTASDGRREPAVDTLDCSASTAAVRRRLLGWQPGDVIQVDGALRRRFWRAASRVLSRSEVQVRSARRLVKAG